MKPFSFVHAADLHIDSPFRGVSAASEDVGRELRVATRRAFKNIVDLCLGQQADFLVISGDIYDGSDRGLGAQLLVRDELQRLADAGISSFVVHGNHDPLDGRVSAIQWPTKAHVFGSNVESIDVEVGDETVATVLGISYPRRDERRNLALKFQPARSDLYKVGVLHCNLGSDTGHDPYAPCELSDLTGAGINYWALGHVHTRAELNDDPRVVYPGNPQGRSIRETGARGCYLVKVDAAGATSLQFFATDVVRWCNSIVDIGGMHTLDELESAISSEIERLLEQADQRAIVCRLRIEGRGPVHGFMRGVRAERELLERTRECFAGRRPFAWVEKLEVACMPEVDLQNRRRGGDLLAAVLDIAAELRENPEALQQFTQKALETCWENQRVAKSNAMGELDKQMVERLLSSAEIACLDLLEVES